MQDLSDGEDFEGGEDGEDDDIDEEDGSAPGESRLARLRSCRVRSRDCPRSFLSPAG